MDRNYKQSLQQCKVCYVATREGGVDRNFVILKSLVFAFVSPPARVAWIETLCRLPRIVQQIVATREGGVDRNFLVPRKGWGIFGSPPARVAWIETPLPK